METKDAGFNTLDVIRGSIQKIVGESRMPTEGFVSTQVLYGGKLVTDHESRMVFDMRIRHPRSTLDRFGDPMLRTFDEHVMRNPLAMLRRHPRWFFRFLMPGAKRYRGSKQEIEENIQRLGLGEWYGPHPWGIEIKRPQVFTKGIPMQDVFRSDLIPAETLKGLDPVQAVQEVAKYMRFIHDNFGGIGEGVPYRFIFQRLDGNRVFDPVLFIPDIVYSKSKYAAERFDPKKDAAAADQKATDYLEFLVSTGFEQLRRTDALDEVRKLMDVANQAYGDLKIIDVVASFAKRGRLTLKHPLLSQHNKAHIGFDPKYTEEIRQKVVEACERFKNK